MRCAAEYLSRQGLQESLTAPSAAAALAPAAAAPGTTSSPPPVSRFLRAAAAAGKARSRSISHDLQLVRFGAIGTKPDETAPSDELERLGREAQAQAEAARLAQEAFQVQAAAEAARHEATALAGSSYHA